MAFHAALFDMDGVVVDTEKSVTSFWQQLAHLERFSISADELQRHVYGRQAHHTLKMLFSHISADRYHEVYARLEANDRGLSYAEIAGATDLLSQLSTCMVPLALVTGAQHWKAGEVLRQLQLDEIFDVRIQAEDVELGKPDPSCYLLAAQRLEVDIDRCVVFEDAISGVTSAVAAGASCVALAPAHRADQMLDAGAMAVVRDLRDVTVSEDHRALHIGPDIIFPFSAPLTAANRGWTS